MHMYVYINLNLYIDKKLIAIYNSNRSLTSVVYHKEIINKLFNCHKQLYVYVLNVY